MKHPQTIKVELKAKHFENSNYTDPWACPLANAVNDTIVSTQVSVDSCCVTIDDANYRILSDRSEYLPFYIDGYTHAMYESDAYKVKSLKSKDIVRTFILSLR